MSIQTYKEAVKAMQNCEGYDCGKPHSDDVIAKAEALLGLTFSLQLKDYLSEYGYIEFFGVELYGIVDEDFPMDGDTYEGLMVEWTLNERKNGLDPSWVALRFEDDGGMAFLDFSHKNSDGEPRVILAEEQENGYEYAETLAEDLGGYFMYLTEE